MDTDLSLLSQLLEMSGKRSAERHNEGGTDCIASPDWPSKDDAEVAVVRG